MAVPNQRDPNDIQLLSTLRRDLDDMRKMVVSRWGRVPILTDDPATPPDGSLWIRSDTSQLRYRSGGATSALPARDFGPPLGTGSAGDEYWDLTNGRKYESDGIDWIITYEPLQTWSNPFTGITGGSLTFNGTTQRQWGNLYYTGRLTFGATPSALASLAYTLPIASDGLCNTNHHIELVSPGATWNPGMVNQSSTTVCVVQGASASTAYVNRAVPSLTVPFTWTTGDFIDVAGFYPMTTPYS